MKRTVATLTATGEQINYVQTSTDAKRKRDIITELYSTGRLGGAFFRNTKGLNNPVKWYIECCLYKNRLINCKDLIDDCYNEAFRHLCEMPDYKLLSVYDESPDKLIAWLLRIISLKCFAVDPRYGNPKHSFVQSLAFTSVQKGENNTIEHCDHKTTDKESREFATSTAITKENGSYIPVSDDSISAFAVMYGFEVEDIVERLNDHDKAIFYGMVGPQPRGKVSAQKEAARQTVINQIVNIKQQLSA